MREASRNISKQGKFPSCEKKCSKVGPQFCCGLQRAFLYSKRRELKLFFLEFLLKDTVPAFRNKSSFSEGREVELMYIYEN